MKQLLLDTLALGKSVVLLREKRELYLLLGVNSAVALVVGLVASHCPLLQENLMKLIMESWKRYLEDVPDHGAELVRLRLSRIDPKRLEGTGGFVADLGDDVSPKTWNINNSVLAALDEEGDHWFLRPHAEDHQVKIEIALQGLERMG